METSILSASQQSAVEHVDGPLLILAGPGSGKTRVVTHRIAYLLQQGIHPANILSLTFTNKAADEMKDRVAALVPGEAVWISTFHRFCSRLLRRHAAMIGLSENFTIYDTSDSELALRHAIDGFDDLNLKHVTPGKLRHAISDAKNKLITAENYQPTSADPLAELLTEIYPAYQRQLRNANAVDFDDLLMYTVELLRENPELRRTLDQQYRYIMVDEYQDTNLAQYAIVRALSIEYPNLSVTGDPDQSIYGWRGADLKNILEFERDYPQVKVVRLEENYRSTPQILRVADQLIRHNRRRKQKSLVPIHGEGDPVRLLAFPNQLTEAGFIAEEIASIVDQGLGSYGDFAIIYRINALSRYLEHALREHRVPYRVLNGVEFYQRREVKDVLAYLQLIHNPDDDVALLRVINTPPRGFGKVSIDRLARAARHDGISMWRRARDIDSINELTRRPKQSLRKFVELIDGLRSLSDAPVESLLGHMLDATGYEAHVQARDEQADEERVSNIRELLSAARQFDAGYDGSDYLGAFLESTSLVADTDAWDEGNHAVTLMTMHAAKGLEFPHLYMVAVEQGKLPHERSLDDPEQLEEERRLMFVGITRARQNATLSYAMYRDYRGQQTPTIASSFLTELPRDEMLVIGAEEFTERRTNRIADPHSHVDDQLADADAFDPNEWSQIEGDMAHEEAYDEAADEPFHDEALDFDPAAFSDDHMAPPMGADDSVQHTADIDPNNQTNNDASFPIPSGALTTAQQMLRDEADTLTAAAQSPADASPAETSSESAAPREPIDPNVFVQGMGVRHDEYGLGKIIALSGEGARRTATVNFVIHGRKSFVISKSTLRPLN